MPVDQLKQENLINAAKTSMSSKILVSACSFASLRCLVYTDGDVKPSHSYDYANVTQRARSRSSSPSWRWTRCSRSRRRRRRPSRARRPPSTPSGRSASINAVKIVPPFLRMCRAVIVAWHTPPPHPPATTHTTHSAIHILKCHGKSSLESHLVDGFALAGSRAAQGMPSVVTNAKIALLDFGLQRHKLQLGVQVGVTLWCCGWDGVAVCVGGGWVVW